MRRMDVAPASPPRKPISRTWGGPRRSVYSAVAVAPSKVQSLLTLVRRRATTVPGFGGGDGHRLTTSAGRPPSTSWRMRPGEKDA